jgi:autotransporter-associated beta strand protein
MKFYWQQAGYDGTRDKRGAEACSSLETFKEGWYGFYIYLPSFNPSFVNSYPTNKQAGCAQIFEDGYCGGSWAALLVVSTNSLVLNYRSYCGTPPNYSVQIASVIPRDTWVPVIIHFIASHTNGGMMQVWFNGAAQGKPSYEATNINFGFGTWNANDTLVSTNPLVYKFGQYDYDDANYTTNETRTSYYANVCQIAGNPTNAWAIANPSIGSNSIVWSGSVNGDWDIGTTANWRSNSTSFIYLDGDQLLFDDTAANASVNLVDTVMPGSLTVSNTSLNYTFSSSSGDFIAGAMSLVKSGSGSLTFSGMTNTFGAGITMNAGTLDLGALSQLAGTVTLTGGTIQNGALTGTGYALLSGTISATLAGNGMAVKTSSGTVTLSGNNTYSGSTTVSNGTLIVSTAHRGGGSFTVQDGNTLRVVNFGNGQSALMGGLTLGDSSGHATLVFTNVLSATIPIINASAAVTVTAANTIQIAGTNGLVAGNTYPLIKYGSLGGAGFSTIGLSTPGNMAAVLTNDTNNSWIALKVINVSVNTNAPGIAVAVAGGGLQLSWPADHTGWELQMQTNPPNTGLGTNWLTMPGSNFTNQMTVPINSANGSAFYRLIYP